MKRHLSTALFTAFTLLAGTAAVSAQPRDRDNDRRRPPVVNTPPVVVRPPIVNPSQPQPPVLSIPNTAPPPLRQERRGRAKRGMVYVEGRWDWQNGNWAWVNGRWEKERAGKRWQAGRWEPRGDRFEWTSDAWLDLLQYPNSAPPPTRAERQGRGRRGTVWVAGHWDWKNGNWDWTSGRWEKDQRGKRWRLGEWQQRGDRWEWSQDGWEDAPAYPTAAPPTPRSENQGRGRRGMVWVAGHWDWKNGNWDWSSGRWEKEQRGKRWRQGEWQQRGDRYEWQSDGWDDAQVSATVQPAQVQLFPTAPPPAPIVEAMQTPRAGYVWIGGNYDWQNGQYAWIAGHWERAKPRQNWVGGQWALEGNHYVWVQGRWQ